MTLAIFRCDAPIAPKAATSAIPFDVSFNWRHDFDQWNGGSELKETAIKETCKDAWCVRFHRP
jgi:hypothetical protein